MAEAALAILAKAPIAGLAKTRLAPLLGEAGAARLQDRLIRHAVDTALRSGLAPVTLWCAPDCGDPLFSELAAGTGLCLASQPAGDLGARMLAAFESERGRPLVLIGTDCPVLASDDLRQAAAALEGGADLVLAPAEDGGYGLVALARPVPALFAEMAWGSDRVLTLTLERADAEQLRTELLRTVWDVDRAADYDRLLASGLIPGL